MPAAGSLDHALSFRVLRLAKPSLVADAELKFNLYEDLSSVPDRGASGSQPLAKARQHPYADRVWLGNPVDACDISPQLLLPQSFGVIHLGEVGVKGFHPLSVSMCPVSCMIDIAATCN